MSETAFAAYVRAAAALQGITLDEAHVAAVAGYLALAAGMATQLDRAGLAPEDEPAEIYCPAPFVHAQSRGAAA